MLNAFNLNYTVVIIIFIIWLLYVILNKVYFDPIGKKIEERNGLKKQYLNEMDSIEKLVQEKTKNFEKSISKAKRESRKRNAELIGEAKKTAENLILKAKEENKQQSSEKFKDIQKEIGNAEKRIMKQIKGFATELKKKIK